MEIAVFHHQLKRAGEEEITDEDAGFVAEDDVGGFLPAALGGIIDDIVVQKRCGMDKFDSRCEAVGADHIAAIQRGRGESHQRADAFAAGGDQVSRQLRDHRHGAFHPRDDHLVHGPHIRIEQGLQAVERAFACLLRGYGVNCCHNLDLDHAKAHGKRFMTENSVEIHVLDHKVRLLQPVKGFRTSLDSVFLAAACPAKGGERVLDMGAGVGGASFCLLWRVPQCHVTGVEIQQSHVGLAQRNVPLNGREGHADFIASDIVDFRAAQVFDHVICNPPYLEAGSYTPAASEERAMALGHEGRETTLEDWIDAGFRSLKSGGSLTMIHRADMVDKIVRGLGRRFGAVEIIPLYPRSGEEARRVIVRAVKDRKSPARLHGGIILHEEDGGYTMAADAILRDGGAIG